MTGPRASNNTAVLGSIEAPQTLRQTEGTPASFTEQFEIEDVVVQSLPPCDGGQAAWKLLLTAFVFEALLWGFPLSFGVFQDYYSQLPQFKGNPYISVVGSTASGISYIGAPIMIPIIKRFGKYRRRMIWFGWPICIIGLVASSFAKSVELLILLQGVTYGLGFIIFYYPIISMVNDFWIQRRGMAYGLLCSASGVSGAAMPFAFTALLTKFGYATTLRAAAVGLVILTGPLIPFLKGRVPESESSSTARTDWTFVRAPLFWIYSLSNLAQGLGYFFPALFLPSYATAIGLSSLQGALLLAVMSVAQVLGQMSFGYLSDRSRVPLNALLALSAATAGVASFACWGLAHTFGVLFVFALLYGFFGAGYTAMWARMGTAVSGGELTGAFASFGLFNLGKGLGNVLSGPISAALITRSTERTRFAAARYEAVVLFVGSCMLFSAMTIGLCYVKPLQKRD